MDGLINGCVAADLAAENMGRRFLLRRFLSQTPTQRTLVQEFAQPGRRTQGKRLWKSLVIIRKVLISSNPPPQSPYANQRTGYPAKLRVLTRADAGQLVTQ